MNLTPRQEAIIKKAGKTIDDFKREMEEIPSSPINRNVVDDIGEGLMLSLQNDDQIGLDLFKIMMKVEELEQRVVELEGGNA
jgi:hypothetical protein